MAIRLFIEFSDKSQILDMQNKAYVFGRSKSCDVSIPDPLISSKHLEITLNRSSEIFIKDLESSNGTFINGSKIISQRLFIGDQLVIGKTLIRLDTNSMSKNEYKEFYNEERTSIKFIDAGVKTASIQRSIYDNDPKKDDAITIKPKAALIRDADGDIFEEKTTIGQSEESSTTPELQASAPKAKPQAQVKRMSKTIKKKEKTSLFYKIFSFLKK